jgi:hypothetical protein
MVSQAIRSWACITLLAQVREAGRRGGHDHGAPYRASSRECLLRLLYEMDDLLLGADLNASKSAFLQHVPQAS